MVDLRHYGSVNTLYTFCVCLAAIPALTLVASNVNFAERALMSNKQENKQTQGLNTYTKRREALY